MTSTEHIDSELKRLDSEEQKAIKDYDSAEGNHFLQQATLKTRIKILLQKQVIYKQELERIKNL